MSIFSTAFTEKRARKSYTPPGSLEGAVAKGGAPVRITLLEYGETEVHETTSCTLDQLPMDMKPGTVQWINVDGIHDHSLIEAIGQRYQLHPLTQEDIANADQRSKFEDYDNYNVMIFKMLYYDQQVKTEQLTIVLQQGRVITFQEEHGGDPFNAIRDRIRQAKGRIRRMGADYLAYALMDAVVDSHFILLDHIGDELDVLDEKLLQDPTPQTHRNLHRLKREMLTMRKNLLPLREMITAMTRDQSACFAESTEVFLRDLLDHTIRVIETLENYRDIVTEMMETYLSTISNRMNEVMKVLTIISTLFIPLTFIVGVYGMNFDYMPELHTRWAYPTVWLVMLLVVVVLMVYFRRKRWF